MSRHGSKASLLLKYGILLVNFRAEIARLQRVVELKTREMNRVKRLAKTILDQVSWKMKDIYSLLPRAPILKISFWKYWKQIVLYKSTIEDVLLES